MQSLLERLNETLRDRYRVDGEIARGGMGVVFEGFDLRHNRRIAIKVLHPELACAIGGERFLREIQITAGLSHPHILPLYDSGEVDGSLFYVMPLIEGDSLRTRLAGGALALQDALRITREVADALAYAHERGFVHRDIKPENILLSAGHALVADFGVARAIASGGEQRLTETGLAIGTPAYMSPEQRMGGEVGPPSDIYALACVLHEMLAGTPPSGGLSASGAPGLVDDIITIALSPTPTLRFASASEFATAVSTAATQRRGLARLLPKRAVQAAIVILGLAGAVGAALRLKSIRAGDLSATEDPRLSILVLPFTVTADKPSFDWLREGSEHMLTLGLEGWREVRVVDRRWLSTLARARRVQLDQSLGLDQALQLARDAHAGTLVVGDVLGQVDSVEVVVRVYDVRTGKSLGQPGRATAAASADFRPLFEQIANRLLDLSGGPVGNARILAATTNSLSAYRDLLSGLAHLYRWELRPAAAQFRAAIGADTSFALAYHYLSITLEWQEADSSLQMAAAAVRHAAALPWRPRQHILAHHAFATGEWAQARTMFHELLARDAEDAEAWLGLGEVEYHDWSLTKRRDGWYLPSASWNVALRAFTRAVDLDPSFHLGYGHLFDIYSSLTGMGGARVFQAPGDVSSGQRIHVGPVMAFNADTTEPLEALTFHPRWKDSVIWLPETRGDQNADSEQVTERLHEAALAVVARWKAAAPDEARPHEILRDWYLEQRSRIGDSVVAGGRPIDQALAEQHLILERETDTVRMDLDRLGILSLAAGRYDSAAAATQAGWKLAQRSRERQGSFAANVYLARGQFARALQRREPSWGGVTTNSIIGSGQSITIKGQINGVAARLESAVAVGEDRAVVRPLWDTIMVWRKDPRSFQIVSSEPLERFLQRNPHIAAPSAMMLSDPALWRLWLSQPGADTLTTLHRTYLRAFSDSSATALRDLNVLLKDMSDKKWRAVKDPFVAGLAAQRLGRDAEALGLLASIDATMGRMDLSLSQPDQWAYLSRSYLLRAQLLERMKDSVRAIGYYQRFLDVWKDADPPLQRFNAEARAGLARLHVVN